MRLSWFILSIIIFTTCITIMFRYINCIYSWIFAKPMNRMVLGSDITIQWCMHRQTSCPECNDYIALNLKYPSQIRYNHTVIMIQIIVRLKMIKFLFTCNTGRFYWTVPQMYKKTLSRLSKVKTMLSISVLSTRKQNLFARL